MAYAKIWSPHPGPWALPTLPSPPGSPTHPRFYRFYRLQSRFFDLWLLKDSYYTQTHKVDYINFLSFYRMSEKTSFFGHFWAIFDPSEKGPKIIKNRDFITSFCSLMLTMLTLFWLHFLFIACNEFNFHVLMSKIVKKCRFLAIFDPQKPPILTPQNRPFLAIFGPKNDNFLTFYQHH